MLIHLTQRPRQEVRAALKRAEGSVKLAALLLEGCTQAEAEAALDRADGQLRAALELVREPAGIEKT
jgi:N-acetylmuramic acid 6-phosphate etherase